jgi:radical SAM protein with 4Fe4S-binding SPASM domain
MRQTGKSTLLQNLPQLKNRRYLNLDDLNTLEATRLDPAGMVNRADAIIIDEAQKLPELLSVIKQAVDRRRKPGQFILSGSANFLLLKSIAESLAGRAVYLTLLPFSHREKLGVSNKQPAILHFLKHKTFPLKKFKPLDESEIIQGGMPSVCLGQVKNPAIWFRGYEQTYLERDIRALSQVADLLQFRNLLQLLALRISQILKTSELARDAKLNVMTTTRYLSLMETSFLLFRPLHRMFGDNAVGCGLCGIFGIIGVLGSGRYSICGIGETTPELIFGHAATDKLKDIWQNNAVLKAIREGLPSKLEGLCGRCLMKNRCLGNCIAQNYYSNQNLFAPYWYCHQAEAKGLFPQSRLVK